MRKNYSSKKKYFNTPPPPPRICLTPFFKMLEIKKNSNTPPPKFLNVGNSMKRLENMKF